MTRKSRPELFLFLNYFEERQHAMIMTYQEVFSYVPQKTQQHDLMLRPYLSLSFTCGHVWTYKDDLMTVTIKLSFTLCLFWD